MEAEKAVSQIIYEYHRATEMNGPFNTAHEGYAVILEELDELWDEIKKNSLERDNEKLKKEAIQVGAMALRFLVDIVDTASEGGEQ